MDAGARGNSRRWKFRRAGSCGDGKFRYQFQFSRRVAESRTDPVARLGFSGQVQAFEPNAQGRMQREQGRWHGLWVSTETPFGQRASKGRDGAAAIVQHRLHSAQTAGSTSPIDPRNSASASESIGVGWLLTITMRAPASLATGTTPATG